MNSLETNIKTDPSKNMVFTDYICSGIKTSVDAEQSPDLTLLELWDPAAKAQNWKNIGNTLGTLSSPPTETTTDIYGQTVSNKLGTLDENRLRFITYNSVNAIVDTNGIWNFGIQSAIDNLSPDSDDKIRICNGVFSLKQWSGAGPNISTTPSKTNISGYGKIYPRSDKHLYYLNDTPEEFRLSPDAGTILTNTDGTGISPRLALWSDTSSPYNSLKGDANLTFSSNILTLGASSTGRISITNTALQAAISIDTNQRGLQTNITGVNTTNTGLDVNISNSTHATVLEANISSVPGNKYGFRITGDTLNFVSGYLKVGSASVAVETLDVNGNILLPYTNIFKFGTTSDYNSISTTLHGSEYDLNVTSKYDLILNYDSNISTAGSLIIKSGTTEIGRFSNAGYLGLGVTPSHILHTNSNIRMQTSTGSNYIISDPAGNGVMTWTDLATLGVSYGSGVAGQVAFWSGTNTLVGDTDLTFSGDTLSATKIIVSTRLDSNGDTYLGNTSGDIVSFTGRVSTSILPNVTDTNSLGSDSLRWKDLFVSGSSINIGDSGANNQAKISYNSTTDRIEFDLTNDGNTEITFYETAGVGKIGINIPPSAPLHVEGGTPLTAIGNSGYAMIGLVSGLNLSLDYDSIQARTALASNSSLHIQRLGGSVKIHTTDGTRQVNIQNLDSHQLRLKYDNATNYVDIGMDASGTYPVYKHSLSSDSFTEFISTGTMPNQTGIGLSHTAFTNHLTAFGNQYATIGTVDNATGADGGLRLRGFSKTSRNGIQLIGIAGKDPDDPGNYGLTTRYGGVVDISGYKIHPAIDYPVGLDEEGSSGPETILSVSNAHDAAHLHQRFNFMANGDLYHWSKVAYTTMQLTESLASTGGAGPVAFNNYIYVNSTKDFPDSGYLMIGLELVLYTSKNYNSFYVTNRDIQDIFSSIGASAVTHAAGETVISLTTILSPYSLVINPLATGTNYGSISVASTITENLFDNIGSFRVYQINAGVYTGEFAEFSYVGRTVTSFEDCILENTSGIGFTMDGGDIVIPFNITSDIIADTGTPATITVNTTGLLDGLSTHEEIPTSGAILIDNEIFEYSSRTGSVYSISSRVGNIYAGSVFQHHPRGRKVTFIPQLSSLLNGATQANPTTPTTFNITVDSTYGFDVPDPKESFVIDGEIFTYTALTTTQFTIFLRNGNSSHSAGSYLIPLKSFAHAYEFYLTKGVLDDYDDLQLLSTFEYLQDPKASHIVSEFKDLVFENKKALEKENLVKQMSDGNIMVNLSRMNMLFAGAIRQLHNKIKSFEIIFEQLGISQNTILEKQNKILGNI